LEGIKVLEAERHRMILRLLEERSIVGVGDFVELLSSSDATVRRDIAALAEEGKLRRVRGGAEAINPRLEAHLVGMPFAMSEEVAVPQKRAIARAASGLIDDNDSIIIAGGTTTYALVEFLALRQLDILTNSLPIVTQLVATSRNRVSMPGGTVYREQKIILSPFEHDATANFWARKAFVGCYGINRHGVMEADPLIVQAEARLLKRTEQVIVMADSRKLSKHSSIVVLSLEHIAAFITDDAASESDLEPIRRAGVNVIVARVEAGDTRGTPSSHAAPAMQ
jgi:DeoR family transcriptional regulator, ulaG and ulaABCDEF operon transcriptional repressor